MKKILVVDDAAFMRMRCTKLLIDNGYQGSEASNGVEAVEKYREYRPDAAAVEELFFARNARTALVVGQARGVAILAGTESGVPVYEYSPLEIKKAVVGYGRAEKGQVQMMVRAILKLSELPPPDAADALAVAICHIHFKKADPT